MTGSWLTESEVWTGVGWTMAHYLWVGALLGLAALASRWCIKSARPNVRYVVALGWLLVLAVAPLLVGMRVHNALLSSDVPALSKMNEELEADLVSASEIPASVSSRDVPIEELPGVGLPEATWRWDAIVGVLPWVWIVGSMLTFAWMLTGVAGAERLRRLSAPPVDHRVQDLCRRLAGCLKVRFSVSVAFCERISSPVLVGIVRPVILLPPGLVLGLGPEQVEMLLLHELAHVRRWDNLVNLLQRTVESLLFFHPAVWLVSRWVRQEREHCCDDLVLRRTADRPAYAETLLVVAHSIHQSGADGLSPVTAGGIASCPASGHLRSRIGRILGHKEETMQVSRKLALTVPIALLTAVAVWGSLGHARGGAEPPQSVSLGNESTGARTTESPPSAREPKRSDVGVTGRATSIVRANEQGKVQREAADPKAGDKAAVEALRRQVAGLRNEIRLAQKDRDKQFEQVVKLTDLLRSVNAELQKYRNEAGHLTISKHEEVHAIGVQVTGALEWKWRVYLPANREYRLHLATGEVPKAGAPGPGEAIGAYTPLHRTGEFLILANVEKNHRGRWVLAVSTPDRKLSSPFQNDAWVERSSRTVSEIKPSKPQSVTPGQPMVLLRLRVDQEGKAPETPCDGLMISIQEIKAE